MQTLNTMGLGRNDRIGIVLPNGPEMAVAFLAIACSNQCPSQSGLSSQRI